MKTEHLETVIAKVGVTMTAAGVGTIGAEKLAQKTGIEWMWWWIGENTGQIAAVCAVAGVSIQFTVALVRYYHYRKSLKKKGNIDG